MAHSSRSRSTGQLTRSDLERVVNAELPGWSRACNSTEADAIILHELAFGTSDSELFLLACAIKYAAGRGKNIHVICGQLKSHPPETFRGSVFRD
jgi:hypothetical protein